MHFASEDPMAASRSASSDVATSEEHATSASLPEGQIYDFITNEPVNDRPVERTLQAVARSLVEEYDFDHTQLQRDQTVVYEVVDDQGKARKVRRKVSVVVYPEGVSKDDPTRILRACLVQSPATKANDGRRGVILLEEVMGALPACDYGLWTNGTDLVFKQKLFQLTAVAQARAALRHRPG
jgi:type I restriction enzyme M protein